MPHLPAAAMMKVRDFPAGLARSNKSTAKSKITIDVTFGGKALRLTSVYYKKLGNSLTISATSALKKQEDCPHYCCCSC
jgi:hypothetical protein